MEAAEKMRHRPKFMPTFKKGFYPGKGPASYYKPETYNQKLEQCIDEAYFQSEQVAGVEAERT